MLMFTLSCADEMTNSLWSVSYSQRLRLMAYGGEDGLVAGMAGWGRGGHGAQDARTRLPHVPLGGLVRWVQGV